MVDKKHILCIDDDSFYRDFYKAIFTAQGFEVSLAADPADGYEAAHRRRPDLIVLDVMMPEKNGFRDGYDLLKKIRAEEGYGDIPVIMISALDAGGDLKHGEEMGAATYLPKQQMTPESLLETVKGFLGG